MGIISIEENGDQVFVKRSDGTREVLQKRNGKLRGSRQGKCQHLGPAIERDGIAIKVKCGCTGKKREVNHTAHRCEKHKRCLPTLVLAGEQLKTWNSRKPESDIYQLCPCEQFEPLTEAEP